MAGDIANYQQLETGFSMGTMVGDCLKQFETGLRRRSRNCKSLERPNFSDWVGDAGDGLRQLFLWEPGLAMLETGWRPVCDS